MQKMFVNLNFEKKCQFGRKYRGKLSDLSHLPFLLRFSQPTLVSGFDASSIEDLKNMIRKFAEIYSHKHGSKIRNTWLKINLLEFFQHTKENLFKI